MNDVFKTDQALLLDDNFNILNKVPVEKLGEIILKHNNLAYLVMDGILTRELLELIEKSTNIKYVVCIDSIQKSSSKVKIYTISDLDKV